MRIERLRVPEGALIKLAGIIDEQLKGDLFDELHGVLAVAIDLAGVHRITSFGIREWIRQISDAGGDHIYFVNVPAYVMAQFGMVAGLGGPRGQILSYFAPYVCNGCGAERDRLFDRRNDSDVDCVDNPPSMPCAQCSGIMEFADAPEYYREALAGTAPLDVVPALFRVLAAKDQAARPLKVSKTVEGSATVLWLSGALDHRAVLRRAADGLEGDVLVVTDQVAACDGPGVWELGRLMSAASDARGRVWLARTPRVLLDHLAKEPMTLGEARLTSIELDYVCGGCRRMGEWVYVMSAGKKGLYCQRCGAGVTPGEAPVLMARLGPLDCAELPVELRGLMELRPRAGVTGQRPGFVDKYQLIRLLGAGGMAEIYLARQQGPAGFERRVAIKRILPSFAKDAQFVSMFLTEAKLVARLSHPNIVQIHELHERDGQYFIVMEYVEGHNLATMLNASRSAKRKVPIEVALRVLADVCAALEAAHTACDDGDRPLGIVHRDVSPHNVLIGSDGVVKLSDFGIARVSGVPRQGESTQPGVLKGKLAYLSPEALIGEPDLRTDVWAAGIVLFQLLAGYHPLSRSTDYQTYQAILNDPVPAAGVGRTDVPPELEAIVAMATARDAAQRYASAGEMQAALEKVISLLGRPVTGRQVAEWLERLEPELERGGPAESTEAATALARGPTETQ